jgi:hypothetical protein
MSCRQYNPILVFKEIGKYLMDLSDIDYPIGRKAENGHRSKKWSHKSMPWAVAD